MARSRRRSRSGPGPGHGSGAARDAIESPYLQLVLTKLWAAERAVGSPALRRSTLVDLGGAESIVRRHLDEVMADLPASDRELAAAAFHHLVTPSGAKVALSAADLAEWTTWPLTQVQDLLDALGSGEQRIVRAVPPPQGVAGPTRYEIYHDVLALAVADWRKRYDAGRAAAQLVREREEALALASATRRRLRRARLVAIGLGALLLAIGALSLFALKLQRDVRTQETLRATLLEAEQLLYSDPTQSLRLSVDADQGTDDEETAEAVLKASGALRYEMVTDPAWCPAERPCGADQVLVTPDGEQVVVLDTSGDTVWLTVRSIADPATGQWVRADLKGESLADEIITHASVNEDASLIGVATRTEAFVVATSTGIATGMDVGGADLYDIEFLTGADDADQVAVSAWDGIGVLDAGTGQVVRELDVEAPWSTAVVADTVVALDGGDRRLKVWGADGSAPLFASDPIPDDVRLDQVLLAAAPGLAVAATGAMNEPMVLLVWRWEAGPALGRHQGSIMKAVNDLRIDERQWFATVAFDKTARQFDLRKQAWRPALPQHSDWVYSAVTVRRGKRILTAGADGAIHYWSTVTPSWATSSARHPVYELLGHAGAALDLATVGPTDRVFVSTGVDRTARIWRLPETRRYEQHRDWVIGLEASSGESCRAVQAGDGDQCLVTVSSDHAALHRLRVDAASPAEVDFATEGTFEPPEGRLLRQVLLRTGPDLFEGIVLYEESAPPELWRWDPEQPDLPARFVRTLDPVPDGVPVDSLSLSADGSMVAGGDSRGRIHVWDVDTGERWEYTLGRRGTTSGLTFDPTGGWVALTTEGGVQIGDWDADPAPDPVDLPCPDDARGCTLGAVHSVFSGDGSRVAVSTWRGDLHVWETGGEHVVGPLELPGLSSSRPALSADGHLLAAGTDDGLIQVWDVETGRVVFRVRRHADSVNAVLFAARPGEGAGTGAQAVQESLLVSVSDDTTAAVIPCAPCADAERAVDAMHDWVDSHPGEGAAGGPAG